jgi:DNA-directed RNA polymerase subunit RPC12/RpoP
MSEYLCLSCFAIFKESELNEKKCLKCGNDNLVKTYNASDGVTITNVDLYK